jgi:hypothetical protein
MVGPLRNVTFAMSTPKSSSSDAGNIDSLEVLESRLMRTLGAVIGGGELSRTLGYPTQGAFRQAFVRDRLPVPVFVLEGRRGRFALTSDIANWLWTQRSAPQERKHTNQARAARSTDAVADRQSKK